jgi:outer membrane protein OmpA-like peptidoglycan-associated protein
MDLLLALGIGYGFELGVALPLTLAQDSEQVAVDLNVVDSPVGPGIGDLRLVPKLRLVERGPVKLAGAMELAFPSGSREDLLGAKGITFTPKVIVSVATQIVDVGFNIGFRIRDKQSISIGAAQEQVTVNDDLVLSLALRVPLVKDHLDLVADTFMALAIEQQDKEEIPLELLAGLRYTLPLGFTVNIGAGPGLTRGVGVPSVRLFAGVGYQYQPGKRGRATPLVEDRDNDGLVDDKDECPVEPEDRDGFKDNDGCPDLDNDNDGILDDKDRCPLEPEDRDGFKDSDGCPDPDNDNDGLPDVSDRCPMEPEDHDKFQDDDGCPDPDNDGDAIPDVRDRCPLQPETVNNVDDDDGCPDQAQGLVQIRRGAIKVAPVYFATGKDVIQKKSEPTLKLLAATLREHKWVKKLRIEGHTDNRGKQAFNTSLSQRRAESVRRFLTRNRVEASRVEALGLGPTQPIADNRTRAGRAQNRRVEFVIIDPPPEK